MSRSRASTSSTNQSIDQSNNQLNNQLTSQSANQSTNQSTNQPKPQGQLWLLKLPNFLSDHFKRGAATASNTPQSNPPLAQLEVKTLEDGSQQFRLKYQPIEANVPKEFILKPRAKRAMLVFQDPPKSKDSSAPDAPCKLVGPITFIADATPVDSPEYRSFLNSRAVARSTRNNTQRFDESGDMVAAPQTIAELERQERKKRAGKESRDEDNRPTKRFRAEREEVEAMLLCAFDTSKYLTFRQLEEITNQPKSFLQEVLGSMCVREQKGENKDKYTLNDKYRID